MEPWYSIVTDDEEFIYSVRDTAQKIAINIANRYVILIIIKFCLRMVYFLLNESFLKQSERRGLDTLLNNSSC